MTKPKGTSRQLICLRTLRANGDVETRELTRCPLKDDTVSMQTCLHCPRIREVRLKDGLIDKLFCDGESVDAEDERPPLLVPRVDVASVMRRNIPAVAPNVTLDQVMVSFLEADATLLPVVSDAAELLGFVTRSEVELDIHARASLGHAHPRTVADVMSVFPLALPEQTPLLRAAAVLSYEKQSEAAVVSRAGEVIGVISTADIVRWLATLDGFVL